MSRTTKMRVLISAYACAPGEGSEPAVGWHWAIETARLGHEAWVVTRAANRAAIETHPSPASGPSAPHFLYYDLPRWARWWKKGRRGIRLYYLLWQWGAYRLARRTHRREPFDRVHHVTFAGIRQPSFMGRLGIPFVFGPVAGGERAPWRLRRGYGWRGYALDAIRDAANFMLRVDPLMAQTFRAAEHIDVTSEQTRDLLPRRFRHKSRVRLAIGWNGADLASPPRDTPRNARTGGPRLLFAGRLVYWKGLHLGLAALRHLLDAHPKACLTVVGSGPDEARCRRLARSLGIAERVDFVPWLAQSELFALQSRHDVFLYPSLHDSGGMVVLEALASGLPVVCLDLGGPGAIVDDTCGRVIATGGRDSASVSRAIGTALGDLAADVALRDRLAAGARRRAGAFSWSGAVRSAYARERDQGQGDQGQCE